MKNGFNFKGLLKINKLLYIFTCWSFINVFLHVFSFYNSFISTTVDYIILGLEICIFAGLRHGFKTINSKILKFDKFMTYLIICDLLELFFIVFAKGNVQNIVFLLFLIKVLIGIVLEFKFRLNFLIISKAEKDKKHLLIIWIGLNFLVFILALTFLFNDDYTQAVFLSIYARYLFALYYIKDTCKIVNSLFFAEDIEIEESPSIFEEYKYLKAIAVGLLCLYGICVVVFSNIYISGDVELKDENGKILSQQTSVDYFDRQSVDVYSYSVRNMMPTWSVFYGVKYGIINVESGYNSGAIFNERPAFDNDGISPDYKGHFVNLQGQKVFDIPYSLRIKKAQRQKLAELILSNVDKSKIPLFNHLYSRTDYYYYKPLDFIENYNSIYVLNDKYYDADFKSAYEGEDQRRYFDHGFALYYSDLKGTFGVVSDTGKILKKPIYDRISLQDNYDIIPVHIYKGETNVLDSNLNYLIDANLKNVVIQEIFYNQKKIFYSYTDEQLEDYYCYYDEQLGDFNYWVKDIDFEGHSEADYWVTDDSFSGKYFSMEKHLGTEKTIVVFENGEEILETDKYNKLSIQELKDKTYCLLGYNTSKNFNILDLDGNTIIPGLYSAYRYVGDGKFFLKGVEGTHNGEAVIADINGNINYTGYTYYGNCENGCLQVINIVWFDERYILYNWVDINGDLLDDWYLYRGEVKELLHGREGYYEKVNLTYIADINERGETYIHWYDVSGNEVLSLRYYGIEKENYYSYRLFGTDVCEDEKNLEYYNKRVFWVQNEKGTLDFYNEQGQYIGTEEDEYDYIYREPME